MITATFTFPKGEFDDAFDALNAEMAQLAAQTTKIARKSLTLVSVGPVTTESPRA
jgi:hypothetical protein